VFIDGKAYGMSPVHAKLAGDRAVVEVRRAGYESVTQDLTLDRDQRLLLSLAKTQPAAKPTRATPTKPAAPTKPKPKDDGFHRFD
jgi:hypothetical protein